MYYLQSLAVVLLLATIVASVPPPIMNDVIPQPCSFPATVIRKNDSFIFQLISLLLCHNYAAVHMTGMSQTSSSLAS